MENIQSFNYKDEEEVIKLWNMCLTRDPICQKVFQKKILLDVNYDENLCLVYKKDNKIVGFILGVTRKYPYEERGLEPERGWIVVVFVHPDYRNNKIGTKLVTEIEKRFKDMGKKNITLASYSPNYFFPGPDKDVYKNSIPFFEKLNYNVTGEAVGMDMILYDFCIPPFVQKIESDLNEQGYKFQGFTLKYTLPLLKFLHEQFPGGWVRNVREALLKDKGEETIIIVLDKNDNVVGYCQRAMDGIDAHFGPFGVKEDLRGKKIGTVLFYKMLFNMYSMNIYHVWLAWTDGEAQKFYERAGMRVNKRHATLKKFME